MIVAGGDNNDHTIMMKSLNSQSADIGDISFLIGGVQISRFLSSTSHVGGMLGNHGSRFSLVGKTTAAQWVWYVGWPKYAGFGSCFLRSRKRLARARRALHGSRSMSRSSENLHATPFDTLDPLLFRHGRIYMAG